MKRSPWRFLWSAQDIRRKLLITFGILVLYRLVAQVPVPGVDREVITTLFDGGGAGATLLQTINMLAGGTLQSFSVLAMGVYPYITAQIIIQLLVPIVPSFKARMEEDQREGRKWMERWTYYMAIPMAALQAFAQINIFNFALGGGAEVIPGFGFSSDADIFRSITTLFVMTAGTMFAIWLGELISEFGIRNQGLSLIIFAGIITQIPGNFARVISGSENPAFIITFLVILLALMIFVIVIVQQGRRNVPVMYPGRRMGNRMSMPVKGTLPLMVNMAGMIPLIFANAFLQFPSIFASFFSTSSIEWLANLSISVTTLFDPNGNWYWVIYFFMVVLFAFFYTTVLFEQQNYGENLKRVGAQIPGVSRGAPTQRYLAKVLQRITLPGAFFLGFVAVMPFLVTFLVPALRSSGSGSTGTLLVSSSGLLIVVGVIRDTFFNIDAELKLHGYDESLLVR